MDFIFKFIFVVEQERIELKEPLWKKLYSFDFIYRIFIFRFIPSVYKSLFLGELGFGLYLFVNVFYNVCVFRYFKVILFWCVEKILLINFRILMFLLNEKDRFLFLVEILYIFVFSDSLSFKSLFSLYLW